MTPAGDERALNRALVSALARRDDVRLLPVLVPAGADVPPVNPLTVLLLVLLGQATAERDAYRDWIDLEEATDPAYRRQIADTMLKNL